MQLPPLQRSVRPRSVIPVAIALILTSSAIQAATIIWSPGQNITGDADVSTAGALVGAYFLTSANVPAVVINGVLFQPFHVADRSTFAQTGNFTLSNGTFSVSNGRDSSTLPPYVLLSDAYRSVVSGDASSGTFLLTISGLTVGAAYEFQWWANRSTPFGTGISTSHGSAAGNQVLISDNVSGTQGGLGQFEKGNFVANSLTQAITFFGPLEGMMNGFQLRQTSVPEPSSYLLSCGGAVLLLKYARAKRKKRAGD